MKERRTLHIVGTAHISSVSVDLSGNVVREVQVLVGDYHRAFMMLLCLIPYQLLLSSARLLIFRA
jgi:hypothetical protein